MILRHTAVILLLGVCGVFNARAAWLTNIPQTVKQPDGSILHCLATGDEYHNWMHDENNYTIIQDHTTGFFVYAVLVNGELAPSSYVPGKVDPAALGLQKGVNISAARYRQVRSALMVQVQGAQPVPQPAAPLKGLINNLVIFVRFSDENEFTDLASMWDTRFNSTAAGVNSMANYYAEVSYHQLSVHSTLLPKASGSTVASYWDSHPRAYYQPYDATTNPSGYQSDRMTREYSLITAAIQYVAPQVPAGLNIDGDNDGYVDNVCLVVDGPTTAWATLLWPHMSSIGSQSVYINGKRVGNYNFDMQSYATTGVLCHEFFHTLGAPDLYHYSYDGFDPAGTWDIMCYNPDPPEHMGAHMKMRYGSWITSIPTITSSGKYALHPLTSATNNCYVIPSPNSTTEHFVVEYRKRQGTFESSVPGDGLLVYRINTAYNGNAGGPPDEVYIYRPGGTPGANGDVYSAHFSNVVGRTAINDGTDPSSFLTDGSPGSLDISAIGSPDSVITFQVVLNSVVCALQTSPPGLSVTVDGVSRTTPCQVTWTLGTVHNLDCATPQTGGTGIQYVWTSWSDGGSRSRTITASKSSTGFAANFSTQYYLTMTAGTGGTVSPAGGWQNKAQGVQISGFPGSGHGFGGWTGSGAGSYTGHNNPGSITMNGPITETASFPAGTFGIGDTVRVVLTTDCVNARSLPSITGSTIYKCEPAGTSGVIVGGPSNDINNSSTYTFYQVHFSDGITGWASDTYLERWHAPPTSLVIGDTVRVVLTTDCVNARSIASLSGSTIYKCETAGTKGIIVGGPLKDVNNASNYLFYQVHYADGITGWSDSTYLQKTSGALPIQLGSFTFSAGLLKWTTISEVDNYGFFVQLNGEDIPGSFIPGNGTSLQVHQYSFKPSASGSYRLRQVDLNGSVNYSDAVAVEIWQDVSAPLSFQLARNYPNPFNPSTNISFSITKEGPVSLRVYDVLGREAATLVNESRKPGKYTEQFNGNQRASGVYMYVLRSAEGQLTGRMLLMK